MPKINKTKYAILGVLSMKPCSGYDIKKFCDQSISHFWNENFGHIYPVLRQMEEEGLLTKETEYTEGKPPRNVYSITRKGEKALKEWLMLPVEHYPARSELLLKMFFAENIPVENIIQKVEEEKERSIRHLERYLEIEKKLLNSERAKNDKSLLLWLASVRCGISGARFMIEWCRETIESFQSLREHNS